MSFKHIPVMLPQAIGYLNCTPGRIYVDCTLGGSGHAGAICKKIIPGGIFIGIDQDIDAVRNAKKVLKSFNLTIHLFHDNFIHLPEFLQQLKIDAVDGILLDLGISFDQLESSGRGFSFNKDEPLDMRMNLKSSTTAEDLINSMAEKNLKEIFYKYGEERRAGQIAKRIVTQRRRNAIRTSKELAQIVCDAVPKKASFKQKIHPATRTFMALRIAVNRELEVLESFMDNVANLLNPKGRLCVLSFHSLEDRIVKHRMKALGKGCICPPGLPECVCNKKPLVRILTKKVLRPAQEEVANNPLARSAKLRVVERI
ncbi:MAG: 16S rRNA (cytosine(1402)-N(4))-methyltransferase RsmH [Deltaproteobacteria bacterium]|nr:16S rRNA (cytosine(1402)-N(4))-methyltransferase RsmH [Deltaproteobacteria bacterium]MBW1957161.1 16S rRNA (cytosine(1402)-N(4))-methyltransferase RsmH [Deltaproteobacteria bacterium]MBW2014725.1 16S rRNA (cytosine(1402)-N(4))-methyltransferase RsmH [Deltaproteobacteria bacterium]MBW2087780.1 16S rRNA (cytosine(1402)-N(4))-methyltransferase RsmH [Deltaproteobacteria bacterium]MBW2321308.1 16S rRNA (cytosine(1402)-N(4))-methyltransferase RsmH [Deltaproteobacteria bacterium]